MLTNLPDCPGTLGHQSSLHRDWNRGRPAIIFYDNLSMFNLMQLINSAYMLDIELIFTECTLHRDAWNIRYITYNITCIRYKVIPMLSLFWVLHSAQTSRRVTIPRTMLEMTKARTVGLRSNGGWCSGTVERVSVNSYYIHERLGRSSNSKVWHQKLMVILYSLLRQMYGMIWR